MEGVRVDALHSSISIVGDLVPESATADFLRAFSAHQPQLFAFVLSLVRNWNDAEEIVQETSVLAWEKYSEFTPGTNFAAWVSKIALLRVHSYRRKQNRLPLPLSDAFVDAIADTHAQLSTSADEELDALRKCLRTLQSDERRLLEQCYMASAKVKDVAAAVGSPAGTVYKTLSRIRQRLLLCIERRLAVEGAS